jgi:hypothetical protein
MDEAKETRMTTRGLIFLFLLLAACFLLNLWGHPKPSPSIPLVDLSFVDTAPVRESYADLKQKGADLSDFDCYACHEKGKPPPLRYDTNHNLIIPEEHNTIVMGHGTHNRNNNCFNCHDEQNLELLQTRDGHEIDFAESPRLCGSCHGPTYRDWEAGVHGRTSGLWNHGPAEFKRLNCVSCHNPHSPKFPGRRPAPGPHPLRPQGAIVVGAIPTH